MGNTLLCLGGSEERRRVYRQACIQLLRHRCLEVQGNSGDTAILATPSAPFSRAQRAHYRLAWVERLARNARPLTAGRVTIRLPGVPEAFAAFLGLAPVEHIGSLSQIAAPSPQRALGGK